MGDGRKRGEGEERGGKKMKETQKEVVFQQKTLYVGLLGVRELRKEKRRERDVRGVKS